MQVDEKYKFFVVSVSDEKVLDFREIFGNLNQVCIEVGCGNGHFIKQKSIEQSRVNILGFEIKGRRVLKILKKLDKDINPNIRVCRFLIDDNINKIIKKNSISTVYINFPDPWPKKRHHKRRLIQKDFLDALSLILKKNGYVHICTDHTGYRDWIIDQFSKRNDYASYHQSSYSTLPYEGYHQTLFEEKQREKGFIPFFLTFRKTND